MTATTDIQPALDEGAASAASLFQEKMFPLIEKTLGYDLSHGRMVGTCALTSEGKVVTVNLHLIWDRPTYDAYEQVQRLLAEELVRSIIRKFG